MSKKVEKMNNRPAQLELPFPNPASGNIRAGKFRTKEAILEAVKSALKNCPLSREQVAEEIARLTGENFSVHTLNNIVAEGKQNRRFPLELIKAFVVVTNDAGVLRAAIGPEFEILDQQSMATYEFGRMVLEDKLRSKQKRQLEQTALSVIS